MKNTDLSTFYIDVTCKIYFLKGFFSLLDNDSNDDGEYI